MRSTFAAPSRRALAVRILAPCCLVFGYLDLVRGGLTAGPLLLVTGYLALVPALLLESR